jgi:hypothetical protein
MGDDGKAALDTLCARLAAAEQERDEAKRLWHVWQDAAEKVGAKLRAAEADVRRLRLLWNALRAHWPQVADMIAVEVDKAEREGAALAARSSDGG